MKQVRKTERKSFTSCTSDFLTGQLSARDKTCFDKTTFASAKKWHPNLNYLKECQIFLLNRAIANTWLAGKLNRSEANKRLDQVAKYYCVPKTGRMLPTSGTRVFLGAQRCKVSQFSSLIWLRPKWMAGWEKKPHFTFNLHASRWCAFLHLYLLRISGSVSTSYGALNRYFYYRFPLE